MQNTVELLGTYGSDITHAQSAWTSTVRDLDEDKLNRVDKMLLDLAKAGHHSPFEKSSLHFLVTTDIASHIHLLKHRISVSINGESCRYKELKEDKYYVPKDFNVEFYNNDLYPENTWAERLKWYTELGNDLYHECLKELTPELGRKRAKESARFFKTYNSQITADIMFNWRSFAHFQKLRNDKHAQLEIREIAQKMLDLVAEQGDFPHTITAMTKAGFLPE